jgi:hypothetical protein
MSRGPYDHKCNSFVTRSGGRDYLGVHCSNRSARAWGEFLKTPVQENSTRPSLYRTSEMDPSTTESGEAATGMFTHIFVCLFSALRVSIGFVRRGGADFNSKLY